MLLLLESSATESEEPSATDAVWYMKRKAMAMIIWFVGAWYGVHYQ